MIINNNNNESKCNDDKIDSDWLKYLNIDNDNNDGITCNNNNNTCDNYNDNDNDDDNINNDNNDNNDIKNDKNIESNYLEKDNNLSKNDLFSDIYISTKTKIGYLDQEINIYDIFWKINLLNYHELNEGFVKKQIKMSFYNKEEVDECNNKLKKYNYYISKQLIDIDNPNGRIKFKNIKVVTIGLSKKDLLNTKKKSSKSAFYNCFVLTLRLFHDNKYKEIHIKIFNTGKFEVPGVPCDNYFVFIMNKFITLFKPCLDNTNDNNNIAFNPRHVETVLINSNFYCKFCINRDKLFNILRHKYNINSCFDPCSYPGIQCEFHYNLNSDKQLGYIDNKTDKFIKISFMIFRTGSILIVGKGDDCIICYIYEFIKNLLYIEQANIVEKYLDNYYNYNNKIKKKKKIKRIISVS
tara:strand:- start:493 stop:1719 length:1227 start_codon:yes stop_codon:yes gene_type:complete